MKRTSFILISLFFLLFAVSCDSNSKKESTDMDDISFTDDDLIIDEEESEADDPVVDFETTDESADEEPDSDEMAYPVGNGKCYTPCKTDYIKSDGTFVKCSSEGIMEGCFFGLSCVSGSCAASNPVLKAGENGSFCESESECPDFQTCIQGKCVSTCDKDSECAFEQKCHKKVCREKCLSTGTLTCSEKHFCKTTNGKEGVCMPVSEGKEESPDAGGSFELSKTGISLSNVSVQDMFKIKNNSNVGRDFTVKKTRHTYNDSSGSHSVENGAMAWINIGEYGSETDTNSFNVFIESNGEIEIGVVDTGTSEFNRWSGIIEVSNDKLGKKQLNLTYVSVPDGQWGGKMHYFANFSDKNLYEFDGGSENGWFYNRSNDSTVLNKVGNSFIQKWGDFRNGKISYEEINAAITSINTGSWNWKSTRDLCEKEEGSKAACFLYDNAKGYVSFTNDTDIKPVPSGMSELPFAVNLKQDGTDNKKFKGKIVSEKALQYFGDPVINISFALDPGQGETCSATPQGGDCLIHINTFSSTVYLGGRYAIDEDEGCPAGFTKMEIPWLVEGFEKRTKVVDGKRFRYECRAKNIPLSGSDNEEINEHISGSNPVPDGKFRKRIIELVDGVLVNQETIIILFKETIDSFFGSSDDEITSYGVIRLQRALETLKDDDYKGNEVPNPASFTQNILESKCSDELLDELEENELGSENAERIMKKILDGAGSPDSLEEIGGDETAHYLCVDTGTFDGAEYDGLKVICPGGSEVRYFTLRGNGDISNLECNNSYSEKEFSLDNSDDYSDTGDSVKIKLEYDSDSYSHNIKSIKTRGTCENVLNSWISKNTHSVREDPVYRCTDENEVYCDSSRENLLEGKTFYKTIEGEPVFPMLKTLIDKAFRYKTRFRSRTGAGIGFAPETCENESDMIPYCYSPGEIERVEERTDCLLAVYDKHLNDLSNDAKNDLKGYLIESFSYEDEIHDGFERLNAELLIMMGDESYTKSFASRFDLAGSGVKSFQGSLFEPNGIDLSGGAGYEMYTLYEAVQYYQKVLDRFYSISPVIWKAIESGTLDSFITQETVTSYFDRLIRASSQKTRAWSEISKRYQNFNRSDLARLVIEKAYTAAYLESVILSKIMLKVADVTETNKRDQITFSINQAQLFYKAALFEMRDIYGEITDDINFFGFAPEYIPFPALDEGDTNAFDKLFETALQKLEFAAGKEENTLSGSREFETDVASFQSELVSVKNNYENQLAELCGTMRGDDGRLYPAIPKYAHLNEKAKLLGNPCGFAGNGAIHEAMGEMEINLVDYEIINGNIDALSQRMKIEVDRHNQFCETNDDLADYVFEKQGEIDNVADHIQRCQGTLNTAERVYEQGKTTAELVKCSLVVGTSTGGDCPAAGVAMGIYNTCMAAYQVIAVGLEIAISELEISKRNKEQSLAKWQTQKQCDFDAIESNATLRNLALDRETAVLEAVKSAYRLNLSISNISKLKNEAERLMVQQEESEQLLINVIAAKNDPNVRIYKNDAVINADKAFNSALAAAYRATKVYEYYTSQSYGRLDQLFLVRMVSYGDYNLENYLFELADAFYEFEENYGNPDTRLAILSLRDDILEIPRIREDGAALSEDERTELFRQKLNSVDMIDNNGYINASFTTKISSLSPVTRNHKIKFIEAEIIGSDTGDPTGRIYLRQRGTSSVSSLAGEQAYYKFPERLGVVDVFYNGARWYEAPISDDSVYRNERFRDRPYANTHWEFIFNSIDEEVNKDINLNSLSDMKVYIYYTDFTKL